MAEEEKPVSIPFKIVDYASEALKKITERTEKLSERVDEGVSKLTEMGAALAGIAGGLGFEKLIETGKESLEQINKLNILTGVAPDKIAAMRDAFEATGMSAEQLGSTMTALSKKALSMDLGGKNITLMAQQMGVALNKGPVEAMFQLADSVQRGKANLAEVAMLTRTSGENAGAMMDLLKGGRKHLEEEVEEARRLNVHLSDPGALERFVQLHEATQRIHSAFRRIAEQVVLKLGPEMAKIADRFTAWVNHVNIDKIINPLVHGLEMAVKHAHEISRVLAANAILKRLTGTGLSGSLMKAGGGLWNMGAGIAGGAGKAVQLAGSFLPTKGIAGMFTKLLGPLTQLAGPLFRIIGGVSGLAVVAAAIYLIVKHLDYFKARLHNVISALWTSMQRVWESLSHLFSGQSAIGKFVRSVGDKLMSVIEFVIAGVGKIMDMIADIIDWVDALTSHKSVDQIKAEKAEAREQDKAEATGYDAYRGKNGPTELAKNIWKLSDMMSRGQALTVAQQNEYRKYMTSAQAMYGDRAGGASGIFKKRYGMATESADPKNASQAGVYQDFRNSRFDITQAFSEGFDPDRVATAFANDLGSVGERKLQSGFAPVFGIR